uniref:Uncharacterized protein n=1 Tax=Homalodisca liturata TaxID=320908 RepID=A0A1B6H6C0_9HEMI
MGSLNVKSFSKPIHEGELSPTSPPGLFDFNWKRVEQNLTLLFPRCQLRLSLVMNINRRPSLPSNLPIFINKSLKQHKGPPLELLAMRDFLIIINNHNDYWFGKQLLSKYYTFSPLLF